MNAENLYQSPESEAERPSPTISLLGVLSATFLGFVAAVSVSFSLVNALAFVERLLDWPGSNSMRLLSTSVCVLIATTVGMSISHWKLRAPESKGVLVAVVLCFLSPLAFEAVLFLLHSVIS